MSPPRSPTVAASVDISTVVAGFVCVVVGHIVGHVIVGRVTVGHVVLGHVVGVGHVVLVHVMLGHVTLGHVGASGGAVGLAVVAFVGQVGGVVLMSSGHSTFIILPAGLHMTQHLFNPCPLPQTHCILILHPAHKP